MSEPISPLGITIDADRLNDAWRSRAWRHHCELGLPGRKDEEWRYSPIASVLSSGLSLPTTFEAALSASPLAEVDRYVIAFVNGRFSEEHSGDLSDLEFGLVNSESGLGELARLDEQTFEVVAHRGILRKPGLDTFSALNTALFEHACLLRIPSNVKLDKPVHIRFVTSGSGVAVFPRVLIIAETGAEALILESHESAGAAGSFSDALVEISIAENAHVEVVKLQDEALDCTHVGLSEVHQAADSAFRHFNVCFGGKLTRNDINVFLGGSNVHTRIDGVVCISGDQHVDNHTRLDHAFPHCDSFEVYKHLLDDSSEAVFNGKIFVHQDAQKTDAKQTNNAILMSPNATMNTKPQLEIFADDVKCTHGATIGQLRTDAMFYLRSRGISESDARALLVYAFAAEVLDQISHEGVREALETRLFEKLS